MNNGQKRMGDRNSARFHLGPSSISQERSAHRPSDGAGKIRPPLPLWERFHGGNPNPKLGHCRRSLRDTKSGPPKPFLPFSGLELGFDLSFPCAEMTKRPDRLGSASKSVSDRARVYQSCVTFHQNPKCMSGDVNTAGALEKRGCCHRLLSVVAPNARTDAVGGARHYNASNSGALCGLRG